MIRWTVVLVVITILIIGILYGLYLFYKYGSTPAPTILTSTPTNTSTLSIITPSRSPTFTPTVTPTETRAPTNTPTPPQTSSEPGKCLIIPEPYCDISQWKPWGEEVWGKNMGFITRGLPKGLPVFSPCNGVAEATKDEVTIVVFTCGINLMGDVNLNIPTKTKVMVKYGQVIGTIGIEAGWLGVHFHDNKYGMELKRKMGFGPE